MFFGAIAADVQQKIVFFFISLYLKSNISRYFRPKSNGTLSSGDCVQQSPVFILIKKGSFI